MAVIFRATFGLADSQHLANKPPGSGNQVFRGRGANGLTEMTVMGTTAKVQDGGADFSAPRSGYVTMRATGPVWVQVAAAPTAAVEADWFIDLGERLTLALEEGDKIAVINDS